MSNAKPKIYFDGTNEALFSLSLVLIDAVKIMLRQKGDIHFFKEPKVCEKEIVQFGRCMRVDGLEKFGSRTLVASVNFYIDQEAMDNNKALGALLVYIPEDFIARLMWLLEYGRIDDDEESEVLDACGTVANLVAGYFVKELSAHGYIHLQMSHFDAFVNSSVNGIEFNPQESVKHEITFFLREDKRIVAELTMAPLKKY